MKVPARWWPWIALIAVLCILWALAVPPTTPALEKGQMTQSVFQARQIYRAIFAMAEDGRLENDPSRGWPGDLADSNADPVTTLSDLVKRLVEYNYLKREDAAKLFGAPGILSYSGQGDLTMDNSGFKLYKIKKTDVANVLFCSTKNYTFNRPLDPHTCPFGNKGFVIFRMGGDGLALGPNQAINVRLVGLMPGHTSPDDPGEEEGNVLK